MLEYFNHQYAYINAIKKGDLSTLNYYIENDPNRDYPYLGLITMECNETCKMCLDHASILAGLSVTTSSTTYNYKEDENKLVIQFNVHKDLSNPTKKISPLTTSFFTHAILLLFSELLTDDTVELVCSRFCDLMKLGMNIQECFDDKNPHKKELEKYKKDIMFLYNTWMDENEKYK